MKTSYLTIKTQSSGIYKEKGSKFLAFAYPVDSVRDCMVHIDSLRSKYHDARHHCYAFRLGTEGDTVRANDDGEPSHSAGDPILGQIKSFELTNVLVVVVRYFGGTKLGVSGLINAYKTVSHEALKQSKTITKHITCQLGISFSYEDTNVVMKLINDYELTIKHQSFDEHCEVQLDVRLSNTSSVKSALERLVQTGFKLKILWL